MPEALRTSPNEAKAERVAGCLGRTSPLDRDGGV